MCGTSRIPLHDTAATYSSMKLFRPNQTTILRISATEYDGGGNPFSFDENNVNCMAFFWIGN